MRKQTIEMLKRLEEEQPIQDELDQEQLMKETKLAMELEKLDLNQEIKLEQLSKEAQQDFLKALKDGRLASTLQLWTPWWTKEPVLIKEKDAKEEKWEVAIKQLPPINKLTKKTPSETLKYNLIDIMYKQIDLLTKI